MAMTKRRWLVAGGIAVPLAAFAAVYLIFFTPDSPERLKLSANGSSAPAGGPSLAGEWKIAAGSVAGYRVREKLAQLPAPSDAVGRTNAITGGFTAEKHGDTLTVKGVRFQADLSKLASDKEKRDNRIRTIGLESDRFPTATFVVVDAFEVAEGEIGTTPAHTNVKGDLTIHGVTKRVTIRVDVHRKDDEVEVVGSLTFPFSQFAMQPPNVPPFVSVTDQATMEFQLFFAKVPA